ncbi:MAG TPA: hypothetical protein VFI47_21920 [Acidimicrobiales bacterium]|nr:hypothetical protein [Acidimicrobiales bacterium]
MVLSVGSAALVATVGTWALVLGPGGHDERRGAGHGAGTVAPTSLPPGCPAPAPAAPAGDVDGDGCPEALVVDGGTITAGPAQFTLGQPGDLLAVGDWNCDGLASPALLRPATGDVFVFSGWAPPGEPVTVTASERVEGGVAIRAEPGDPGCDRLQVDLAGGATATVAVAG